MDLFRFFGDTSVAEERNDRPVVIYYPFRGGGESFRGVPSECYGGLSSVVTVGVYGRKDSGVRVTVYSSRMSVIRVLRRGVGGLLPSTIVRGCLSNGRLVTDNDGPSVLFLSVRVPKVSKVRATGVLHRSGRGVVLVFIATTRRCIFRTFSIKTFRCLIGPFSSRGLGRIIAGTIRGVGEDFGLRGSRGCVVMRATKDRVGVFLHSVICTRICGQGIVVRAQDASVRCCNGLRRLDSVTKASFFQARETCLMRFGCMRGCSTAYMAVGGKATLVTGGGCPRFIGRCLGCGREGKGRIE